MMISTANGITLSALNESLYCTGYFFTGTTLSYRGPAWGMHGSFIIGHLRLVRVGSARRALRQRGKQVRCGRV